MSLLWIFLRRFVQSVHEVYASEAVLGVCVCVCWGGALGRRGWGHAVSFPPNYREKLCSLSLSLSLSLFEQKVYALFGLSVLWTGIQITVKRNTALERRGRAKLGFRIYIPSIIPCKAQHPTFSTVLCHVFAPVNPCPESHRNPFNLFSVTSLSHSTCLQSAYVLN